NSSDFDLIEYHIRRYLNHQYSPCTDFFRFVCDSDQIGNNSLTGLSEDFYERILISTPLLYPTQIDNDLINLPNESGNSTEFSSIEYSMALSERCGSNQSCFVDEFKLTYQVFTFLRLNSTLLLQGTRQKEHTASLFYEGVRKRMRVMERLEGKRESLDMAVRKTRELAIEMAQGLLQKFKRTPWLRVTNLFHLPTFVQFSTILQKLTLRTDFDEEFDFNDLGGPLYTTIFSLLYSTSQISSLLRREGSDELFFRLSHSLQLMTGNVEEE
ncbi:hypothetical protein PENTCL1PPCAC_11607, partial [Pristionchus entomophagus]